MTRRPLVPGFLNKLDRNLLLKRPDTWSLRLHLVLYYGLLFAAAVTLICFVIPNDARDRSYAALWSVAVGVLSLMGFIVWLIYLLRFNVFKQYGKLFPGDRLKTFIAYYIIIALMTAVAYIPVVAESVRANMAYSSDELANDVNRMNELIARAEKDRIPDEWFPDTLLVADAPPYDPDAPYRPNFTYTDTANLRWQLRDADSVVKVHDRMYIRWNFFRLVFVENYKIGEHAAVPVKGTKELYYDVFRRDIPMTPGQHKELQDLLDKYQSDPDPWGYYGLYSNNSNDLHLMIASRYDLYSVNNAIEHISERKYRLQHRDITDVIRGSHYVALALALLVFMFRHTTIRTFFFSLLTLIILSILTGLIVAATRMDEIGGLGIMLLYYVALFVFTLFLFRDRTRNVFRGIALNLVVLSTAFIPVIGVGLYYAIRRWQYEQMGYYNYYYDNVYANMDFYVLLGEIAGLLLLLVSVELFFKPLYRAWYAAPEE